MCNLSGRRVVVSINSTSERSCLCNPGLMILELRRVKIILRRLVSKKMEENGHQMERGSNLRITET